jgi:hypothetical protein
MSTGKEHQKAVSSAINREKRNIPRFMAYDVTIRNMYTKS